jgi:hypothetical protein
MSLLTRSLRVTHENLKTRDARFVAEVDRWFAAQAEGQSRAPVLGGRTPPPMFTPFRLREMVLPNRIVVSPMCQYSAEDGTPNDWHLVNLGSRAVGGAALVMAEMTDVSREGRITPGCTGMYRPEHLAAWKRIVDFVHAASPARIALQLAHAGRKGSTRRLWEGMDEPLPEGNWPLISASALPYHPHSQVPKAMDRRDMDTVRDQFVRAARMAEQAGFDMLELHMAQRGLVADPDFGHGVTLQAPHAEAGEAFDQRGRAARLGDHHGPRDGRGRIALAVELDEMDRFVEQGPGADADRGATGHQSGVERHHGIVLARVDLGESRLEPGRRVLERVAERERLDAGRLEVRDV